MNGTFLKENDLSKPSPLPNLFLIGAPKAGTSAIAAELAKHPDIFCEKKEPRYFDADVFYSRTALYPLNDLNEYLDLFNGASAAKSKYRLDASVFIMYSRQALIKIKNLNPEARFILVLRDPLTAAKSMFIQRQKSTDLEMREVSNDFCTAWSKVELRRKGTGFPKGCKAPITFQYDRLYHYEWYMPSIIDEVSMDNILILRYEDYKNHPTETLEEILKFLELPNIDTNTAHKTVNPSEPIALTQWNSIIEKSIKRTSKLRSLIGLSGQRVDKIKTWVRFLQKKEGISVTSQCDKSVTEEFRETYNYLKECEKKNKIKRIHSNPDFS